jgi:hypothetical protein
LNLQLSTLCPKLAFGIHVEDITENTYEEYRLENGIIIYNESEE